MLVSSVLAAVAAKPKCTRLGAHRAAVRNAGAMPRPERPRTTCIGCASRQRTFVVRQVAFSQSVVPAAVASISLRSPTGGSGGRTRAGAYSEPQRFNYENFSFTLSLRQSARPSGAA